MGAMKFNEKQAALWQELGETVLDAWVRASDLSVPDDVALDRAFLLSTLRRLQAVGERWAKEGLGNRDNTSTTKRKNARLGRVLELLPTLVNEFAEGHATMTVHTTIVDPEPDEDLN